MARNMFNISPGLKAIEEIERVDRDIVRLLDIRFQMCRRLGQELSDRELTPEQIENHLFRSALSEKVSSLPSSDLEEILRSISSVFRMYLEASGQPISCAYTGPRASVAHLAASTCFGNGAVYWACGTEKGVLEKLQRNEVTFGVLTDENVGNKKTPLNGFEAGLKILKKVSLPLHLCLIGRGDLSSVKTVYVEPVTGKQCERNLANLPRAVQLLETGDSFDSGEEASRNADVAIVAGPLVAKMLGLNVIRDHLEDHPDTQTVFCLVSRASQA